MSEPVWLPTLASLRSLLGEKVALVQAGTSRAAEILEVAGRIQLEGTEVRIRVVTDDGDDLIVHLAPEKWDEVERVFPETSFDRDEPIRLDWLKSTLVASSPRRLPSHRARLSSLAN